MREKTFSIMLALVLIFSLVPMSALNALAAETVIYGIRCSGAQPNADILVRVGGREYTVPTMGWAAHIVYNIVNTVNADPNATVVLERTDFDNSRTFSVTAKAPGTSVNLEIVMQTSELERNAIIELRTFSAGGNELALLTENVTYANFAGGAAAPPPPPQPPAQTTTLPPPTTTLSATGAQGDNQATPSESVSESVMVRTSAPTNSDTGLIITLILAIFIIGGGAAVIIMNKKRKNVD